MLVGYMRINITFKRTNNVLFLCVVAINLYIIAAPVLPQLTYWWQSHHSSRRDQLTKLVRSTPALTPAASKPAAVQPNSLIIPAMMLNQPTVEGPEKNWSKLLKDGIWRWPASSTPDKGGNTVFLAHRFSYSGPHGAFYYLDKLHPGDDIGVVWNNKTYTYTVTSSREVPPTETSIQDNTATAQITLFTCTPLWHPVNRLVVVAKLKGDPAS